MKKIIAILRDTTQPPYKYVWRAALISFIPSILIGMVVSGLAPDNGPTFEGSTVSIVIGVVLLSPLIETLLMIPILWIIKRFTQNLITLAISSAVTWAVLHSLAAPAWGFSVVWAFFVFSLSFLVWDQKSRKHAILVTTSIHMCQNLIPALAIIMTK